MSEKPWYHQGLKFECAGCGDCCIGAPGYVWVNKAEIAAMAGQFDMEVAEFERQYVRLVGIRKSLLELADGDCIFFDRPERTCRVYHVRPRQCRTWPFWASNLRSRKDWDATALECRGANQGPTVPLYKIEAQAGQIRV